MLEDAGYNHVEDPSSADLLIYNTCSIREKAEHKLYSALGMQVPWYTVSCNSLCVLIHLSNIQSCIWLVPLLLFHKLLLS